MKKQIFDALKTKFDGVQDSVLNRVASAMAKTVLKEEDVAGAVENTTMQQVIDSYGDIRATEASVVSVKNFREKYKIGEDGKLIERKVEPVIKDEPIIIDPNEPAWFKAYREKAEKEAADLKARLEGIDKAKTQSELMLKLGGKLKEKGVDESFIPLFTRNLAIESEDKLDELVTGIHKDYTDLVQRKADEGVVISIPASAQGKPSETDAVAAGIAEKRNTGSSEGIKGKEL